MAALANCRGLLIYAFSIIQRGPELVNYPEFISIIGHMPGVLRTYPSPMFVGADVANVQTYVVVTQEAVSTLITGGPFASVAFEAGNSWAWRQGRMRAVRNAEQRLGDIKASFRQLLVRFS